MADLLKMLKDIKTEFNCVASAIISRDGVLISADMPEGTTHETFTIMCATMMGAASTAHSELKIGQPLFMRILSEKHEMILSGTGKKALIIAVVPLGANLAELKQRLDKILEAANIS